MGMGEPAHNVDNVLEAISPLIRWNQSCNISGRNSMTDPASRSERIPVRS